MISNSYSKLIQIYESSSEWSIFLIHILHSKQRAYNWSLIIGERFLFVLVDFEGQPLKGAVGEEVKVDEHNGTNKAPHLVQSQGGQVRILHPVLNRVGHLRHPNLTSFNKLNIIAMFNTLFIMQ